MMGGQETVFHWVSILENQPIINKTKHPTKWFAMELDLGR
jgi:hypothetical protein